MANDSNRLTRQQAKLIMEAHEIAATLDDAEERELLEGQNPELAEAYRALQRIALMGEHG